MCVYEPCYIIFVLFRLLSSIIFMVRSYDHLFRVTSLALSYVFFTPFFYVDMVFTPCITHFIMFFKSTAIFPVKGDI